MEKLRTEPAPTIGVDMLKRIGCLVVLAVPSLVPAPATAQSAEKIDAPMVAKIRDEGLNRSQVMDHMVWLTDIYGPRLTGSPTFRQAGDWAIKTLGSWGLSNPHFEPWSFGKGWSLEHFDAHMIEPQV